MDKKCLVSKGTGACKNSGSSSSHPSFVSLNGRPEFGFLNEGTSVTELLLPAGKPQTPLKAGCGWGIGTPDAFSQMQNAKLFCSSVPAVLYQKLVQNQDSVMGFHLYIALRERTVLIKCNHCWIHQTPLCLPRAPWWKAQCLRTARGRIYSIYYLLWSEGDQKAHSLPPRPHLACSRNSTFHK